MDNKITLKCPHCEVPNEIVVSETANEHEMIYCQRCGHDLGTVGQIRAQVAQQVAVGGPDAEPTDKR